LSRLSIARERDAMHSRLIPTIDAHVRALVGKACTVEELRGRIVLWHGDIARDQLLPHGFDFLEAPDHRRIYALLEGAPVAPSSAPRGAAAA
jgi:hypothetical protein